MPVTTKPCSCVRPAQCWGGMDNFIICQNLREKDDPLGFWAELSTFKANVNRDLEDE